MNNAPPIDILDSMVVTDPNRDLPLYVQVRKVMRQVIDEHFEDGQQFWTEQALIDRLSVSQITVRRALNDLAKDGFLTRRAAKGTIVRKATLLKTNDFRVAVFVPKHNSDILTNALENLADVCHERQQRMETHYTNKGQSVTESLALLEHPAETLRVILLGQPRAVAHEMIEVLTDRGYRAIAVETTIATDQTDYVGFDDKSGVELALDHLVNLGHRRITFLISEPDKVDDVILRRIAFEDAAKKAGLAISVHSCGTEFWSSSNEAAYQAMPAIWNQPVQPTAILTVSDAGAWAALKWFAEQGVKVPDQVSVMGFDDDRLSQYTHPSLTTLGRDRHALAAHALDVLSHPVSQRGKILMPPQIIVRASTGPVPA